MSETTTFATTQIGVFNPGRLSDNEIERAFVTRIKLFEYLLKGIVAEKPEAIPQHYLVIGQRGMGKSTLLHRIAVELRKEMHGKDFIPLTFPEEQYNVDRLSKFWLNCLDALADALDREGSSIELAEMDGNIRQWAADAKDITATEMYDHFARWIKRVGRRPVLLVDNLGLIFDRLSREDQHELRAILMDKGAPILLGASANTIADTVDYAAPFYDAFQIQYLKKLTFEETQDVLRNLADLTNNSAFISEMEANRARLRTLYQLTGGTPRTIVMLYPLIQNGFSLEVQNDLEGLMDVMTPLYKARFEELPEQMQVILDAVALNWDPIALDSLRQTTQLKNPQLSPQLNRLREVGWLERLDAYEKKGNAYQISERFFNIWYLMRRSSRRQKKELLCLTKFLVSLYGEELQQIGQRALLNHSLSRDQISLQLAIAQGVNDARLTGKLESKSYNELLDLLDNDSSILKDFDIPKEIIGEREKELLSKAHDFFISKNWLEALIDFNKLLKVNPENVLVWHITGHLYAEHVGDFEEAERAYMKAIKINKHFDWSWNGLGDLYQNHLGKYGEAEEAYLKAVEINEHHAYVWYKLGSLYQDLNRFGEAQEAFLKAIEIEPDDAILWFGLGSFYQIHFGMYEEAEMAYLKSVEIEEQDADSWGALGDLYHIHLGRYDEAEKTYLRSIEIDDKKISTWYELGNLYHDFMKRYDEAEQAYLKAIEIDNLKFYLWDELGSLYHDHLERYEEAEQAYLKSIEINKENISPKMNLVFLYRDKMHLVGKAKELFKKISDSEELDSYWLNASLFELYEDNLGKAKVYLSEALKTIAADGFFEDQNNWWRYAAVSIQLGCGQTVLDTLQEHGYNMILRPYYVAIQSLLVKDSTAFLNSIAAEVREVAADLAERIKRYM